MRRDSRSLADTYQEDLAFFDFFDELWFVRYRHLRLRVGMCEDSRPSKRVGVVCISLCIRIYHKAAAAAAAAAASAAGAVFEP